MSFSALGLSAHFLPTLEHLGFNTPTDVQKEAIPLALNGRDLMVSAQTGSGKTAAFMLPSLQRVTEQGAYLQYMERQAGLAAFAQKPGTHPQTHGQSKQRRSRRQRAQHKQRAQRAVSVLVLTPTRELAMQVGQATKDYAACLPGLQTAVVVGGVPYGPQIKALAGSVDVLVATPGRLMDHLKANRVTLGQVQTLVLDEADRMLDMGFIHDIRSIVSQTAQDRQTLLFSATLEASV